jgi:multiple sugar transport system ATP-binding protein
VVHCDVDASTGAIGDEVVLGARPEHLRVNAGPNLVTATVTFVESLGSSTQAYCTLPGMDDALTVTLSGQSRVVAGEVLPLGIAANDAYLFAADGHAYPRVGRNPAAANRP